MFVAVDKIHNPKSEDDGKWCVYIEDGSMNPMRLVFMCEHKEDCVEYARSLSNNVHISNGVGHGCKW